MAGDQAASLHRCGRNVSITDGDLRLSRCVRGRHASSKSRRVGILKDERTGNLRKEANLHRNRRCEALTAPSRPLSRGPGPAVEAFAQVGDLGAAANRPRGLHNGDFCAFGGRETIGRLAASVLGREGGREGGIVRKAPLESGGRIERQRRPAWSTPSGRARRRGVLEARAKRKGPPPGKHPRRKEEQKREGGFEEGNALGDGRTARPSRRSGCAPTDRHVPPPEEAPRAGG